MFLGHFKSRRKQKFKKEKNHNSSEFTELDEYWRIENQRRHANGGYGRATNVTAGSSFNPKVPVCP